jgi:hypothetical protein
VPEASSAQAEVWLTEMAVAPFSPVTMLGVDEAVVVPLPRLPNVLFPQHPTLPPESKAHATPVPTETALTPANPVTGAGLDEGPPQHCTVPGVPAISAQAVPPATETPAASVRPVTATGVVEHGFGVGPREFGR